MLKSTLLFLLFIEVASAARLTLDERRQKILGIVDEELAEVSRLARTQNFKSPDTLLRMAELNLEKARLFKEVENEQYLAIPPEERAKVNKTDYFSKSSKFFDDANDAALVVVKKFPNYSSIGDVYYILAYNYKELGNNEAAMKYFKLASGSAKDPKIAVKSKLALADYYYNDKKYKEAIPLYEATLNRTDDKWWTKDAFNLAWSYYRVKNYDRAISMMKDVHQKSGGKYVDMRSQVERDIGIFYVDANRINEAIQFYEKNGLNYTEQFVKISTAITSQGRFEQAEKLLAKVKSMEKDRSRRTEIMMAELNLFDKFNKIPEHLAICRELVLQHSKSPLEKTYFDRLSFHVNKKAAELQKAAASDIYKSVPKTKAQKAKESMAYFELAAKLNPEEKAEKVFFQAETAYVAEDFGRAIGLYIESFDSAKSKGNKKILSQSLEGMLSSLGQPSLSKAIAEKSYIPVYSRFIEVDTKSERASSIFVKLFNAQFDANDIAGAEETMGKFAKNFPKYFKTQEGMLAKIMEHYRSKKDYASVKRYVERINQGEFRISKKYAEALKTLMTKIQIEGVQQSLEKGEKATALKGYLQIYESSESTPKAKTNAAYNLAALYFEMGETAQSYQWAVTALNDMEVSDVAKFSDSFLSMAAGYFLRQGFEQSADLSDRMLTKLCRENSSNKPVAYKNAIFISLASGDIDKALEVRSKSKSCGIPDQTVAEVSLEITKELIKLKRWEKVQTILEEMESNSRNFPNLIKPYEDLRKEFVAIGIEEEGRKIFEKQTRFYREARAQKLDIPVEALDLMAARMLKSVEDKRRRLEQLTLSFPEELFNSTVKSKLQLLDQMATEVNEIQKIGSGKGIVDAYNHVIISYETFARSLRDFIPEGKSPEYVESFKKAMAEVHGPILQNANKQRAEIRKLIMENKILSASNFNVLFSQSEAGKRYLTEKEAILMDRGGRR
jgi:tetratricopeptide (TPR) repeat protein